VLQNLIGTSPEMALVRRMVAKAARNRLPVLLLGETGTGKEVVARGIFEAAPRGQFVPIDCGSLVGTLMESELFGNIKGAFTGAAENRKGLVEAADGGTAFFDEIGDLPLEMQVKLLRLLQESEFRAVGSLHWRKVDIRIVAATHRDLHKEIAAGRFREDLFFRLNVFSIRLPSLRERMSDVPVLVAHFLQQNREQGLPSFEPPRELLDALQAYDWPGNVRELKHCIERMAAMYSEGAPFPDLPSALRYRQAASDLDSLTLAVDDREPELEFRPSPPSPVISISDIERQAICAALAQTNGERAEAAKLLHIGRTTLYRKMKQYGVG
jgi:DNA-binding NtrC family response regulator